MVLDEGLTVRRTYFTRGMENKVLGDALMASRQKHIARKKQRTTMVVEEGISEDKLVDIDKDVNINWTKSEDEGNTVTQGPS